MDRIVRLRHAIAPSLGAAVIVIALFVLNIVPTVAILLGALVWAGTALLLSPRQRFKSLLKLDDLKYDAGAMRSELETAVGRIASLRRMSEKLGRPSLTGSLVRIADSADALIALDAEVDPLQRPDHGVAGLELLDDVLTADDGVLGDVRPRLRVDRATGVSWHVGHPRRQR